MTTLEKWLAAIHDVSLLTISLITWVLIIATASLWIVS